MTCQERRLAQGALAQDGSTCDVEKHFPWDPCTWLMPELHWQFSYACMLGVAVLWLLGYSVRVRAPHASEKSPRMHARGRL